ncbi:zinc-binding dehydrogenase [Actinomadura sediminis]|uniref:Zinc-binding dehydrogenase n=1 Tax=Actinomadura sediminis TaxID=1038904 RepID=A0ABW3EF22_9ACTN
MRPGRHRHRAGRPAFSSRPAGDAARLAELVARVDAGELTIDVGERRPLADLADVHDAAVAGRLPGKVVLSWCRERTGPVPGRERGRSGRVSGRA